MISNLELIGMWRVNNPCNKKYTLVSGKRPVKRARLDFFLTSSDIHAKVIKCTNSFGYRSNHSFNGIELYIQGMGRAKEFWKLNSSLLSDTTYSEIVKKGILQVVDKYKDDVEGQTVLSISKQLLLKMIKLRVRSFTIPYCARKKKLENEKEAELEKQKI